MKVVVTTVWSYKSCKAPVKSSPLTNQHHSIHTYRYVCCANIQFFYKPDALPVTQPIMSKQWYYLQNLISWRTPCQLDKINCWIIKPDKLTFSILLANVHNRQLVAYFIYYVPLQGRRKGPKTSSAHSPSLPLSPPLRSRAPSTRSRGPWSQLGGLGERCKLPQRGLGRSPRRHRIWCILALKSAIWWQQFWRKKVTKLP